MRRLNAILFLLSAVLLGSCQASSDSTSANGSKPSGGILSVLRPHSITVPQGATLALVLQTAISSATSRSGDLIVANLADDVRVEEEVVVPAGTEVRGRVTSAVPSGRVKGLARLAFDFDGLVVKGREHSIGTSPVDITAKNSHKRDAEIIGGAGAGALTRETRL